MWKNRAEIVFRIQILTDIFAARLLVNSSAFAAFIQQDSRMFLQRLSLFSGKLY
jgi:hypothetical protein